jgi:hypothetical protein
MIQETLTAATYEEICKLKDAYFSKYHPAGYGTMATKPVFKNDQWSILVDRAKSCG